MRFSILVLMVWSSLHVLSCGRKDGPSTKSIVVDTTQKVKEYVYALGDGAKIIVSEVQQKGDTLRDIRVYTSGLETNYDYTIKAIGKIKKSLLADIDTNGYKELYILTQPAYLDPYAKILAFGSDENKRIIPILVTDVKEESKAAGGTFFNYQGADSLYLIANELVRSFPVYTAQDTAHIMPIGYQELRYGLQKQEGLWQLVVHSSVIVKTR